MRKHNAIILIYILSIVFINGCSSYRRCMKTNPPVKDKTFFIKKFDAAVGIPYKIPILNFSLDSIIKFKVDSLGWTVKDKTVQDTLEQRLNIYKAKMCYCQFKTKKNEKQRCENELRDMGSQLLDFLMDNISSIDSMTPQTYNIIHKLYLLKLNALQQNIYKEKSKFYKKLINKEYSCDIIDEKINNFCNTIASNFEKEYKNFLYLQKMYNQKDNIGYINFSHTNCIEEFQTLKKFLCDTLETFDTCKILCKNCETPPTYCKCYKPPITDPPPPIPTPICEGKGIHIERYDNDGKDSKGNFATSLIIGSTKDNKKCSIGGSVTNLGFGVAEYEAGSDYVYKYFSDVFLDSLINWYQHESKKEKLFGPWLIYLVGTADAKGRKNEPFKIKYSGYKKVSVNDTVEIGKYNLITKEHDYKNFKVCGIYSKGYKGEQSITLIPNKSAIQTNEQLAYLRIYPFIYLIKQKFKEKGIKFNNYKVWIVPFETSEDDKGTFRKVEVHILINKMFNKKGGEALKDFEETWIKRMLYCK